MHQVIPSQEVSVNVCQFTAVPWFKLFRSLLLKTDWGATSQAQILRNSEKTAPKSFVKPLHSNSSGFRKILMQDLLSCPKHWQKDKFNDWGKALCKPVRSPHILFSTRQLPCHYNQDPLGHNRDLSVAQYLCFCAVWLDFGWSPNFFTGFCPSLWYVQSLKETLLPSVFSVLCRAFVFTEIDPCTPSALLSEPAHSSPLGLFWLSVYFSPWIRWLLPS